MNQTTESAEAITAEQGTALVEGFLKTGKVPKNEKDSNYFAHAIDASGLSEQAYMDLYKKLVKIGGKGYIKDQVDTFVRIATKEHLKRKVPPLELSDLKSKRQFQSRNMYFELTSTLEKIDNQDFLKEVVDSVPLDTEFKFSSPESYAVTKITDQPFLHRVAHLYHDYWIRESAINHIDDPDWLALIKPEITTRIPNRDKDFYLRNISGVIDRRIATLKQPTK